MLYNKAQEKGTGRTTKYIQKYLYALLCILGVCGICSAQDKNQRSNDFGRMPTLAFKTQVPKHPYDLILGKPTDTTIELSALCYEDLTAWISYTKDQSTHTVTTAPITLKSQVPYSFKIDHLVANTTYTYTFYTKNLDGKIEVSEPYTFTTARTKGSSFTFTVQSDSHLDFGTDPLVYIKSLTLAAKSRPDFHLDIGDTFMTDKRNRYQDALPQYLAQRYYLGLIGKTAPVFMVLGNHDGESSKRGRNGSTGMATWANSKRRLYFPNPTPNEFYSGDTTQSELGILREDYYAFTWGDALFIILNPYTYSQNSGRNSDNWERSLGQTQYQWLEKTLQKSNARFKFVFLHNLVGGETPEGRGGAEASHFFEWGGKNLDGKNTFSEHRPNWDAPIHDLLVKYKVSIVFHGHDHFYDRQERDGIIYQLVPQPSHSKANNPASPDEYGYHSGVIQGASGIIRIQVSESNTHVEYVRTYPDKSEGSKYHTGAITDQYDIKPDLTHH